MMLFGDSKACLQDKVGVDDVVEALKENAEQTEPREQS